MKKRGLIVVFLVSLLLIIGIANGAEDNYYAIMYLSGNCASTTTVSGAISINSESKDISLNGIQKKKIIPFTELYENNNKIKITILKNTNLDYTEYGHLFLSPYSIKIYKQNGNSPNPDSDNILCTYQQTNCFDKETETLTSKYVNLCPTDNVIPITGIGFGYNYNNNKINCKYPTQCEQLLNIQNSKKLKWNYDYQLCFLEKNDGSYSYFKKNSITPLNENEKTAYKNSIPSTPCNYQHEDVSCDENIEIKAGTSKTFTISNCNEPIKNPETNSEECASENFKPMIDYENNFIGCCGNDIEDEGEIINNVLCYKENDEWKTIDATLANNKIITLTKTNNEIPYYEDIISNGTNWFYCGNEITNAQPFNYFKINNGNTNPTTNSNTNDRIAGILSASPTTTTETTITSDITFNNKFICQNIENDHRITECCNDNNCFNKDRYLIYQNKEAKDGMTNNYFLTYHNLDNLPDLTASNYQSYENIRKFNPTLKDATAIEFDIAFESGSITTITLFDKDNNKIITKNFDFTNYVTSDFNNNVYKYHHIKIPITSNKQLYKIGMTSENEINPRIDNVFIDKTNQQYCNNNEWKTTLTKNSCNALGILRQNITGWVNNKCCNTQGQYFDNDNSGCWNGYLIPFNTSIGNIISSNLNNILYDDNLKQFTECNNEDNTKSANGLTIKNEKYCSVKVKDDSGYFCSPQNKWDNSISNNINPNLRTDLKSIPKEGINMIKNGNFKIIKGESI